MSSNKSFGILFFVVFLLIGLWPLVNQGNPRQVFIIFSLIFLILGIFNSKLLTPLNKTWIKFGELLGRLIAPIVMAIVYFIVLTPISLMVRLFGKDLLNLSLKKKKKTYWITRDKKIGSMKRQF
tara:strand:- start:1936 stop:2307 length:372 start_codon:yes stop_codon:yes gene_type:complete